MDKVTKIFFALLISMSAVTFAGFLLSEPKNNMLLALAIVPLGLLLNLVTRHPLAKIATAGLLAFIFFFVLDGKLPAF